MIFGFLSGQLLFKVDFHPKRFKRSGIFYQNKFCVIDDFGRIQIGHARLVHDESQYDHSGGNRHLLMSINKFSPVHF